MPDTHLMQAVRAGKNFLPEAQLKEDLRQQDEYGWTALMYAAQNGNLAAVKRLASLENGMQDNTGKTALIHAVLNSMSEAAKILSQYEAGLAENTGRTALMFAAKKRDTVLCSMLAPKEAGMQDKVGLTAMMHALDNRFDTLDPDQFIFEDGYAVVEDVCKMLMKEEAGKATEMGITALMFAAEAGNEAACRLLINHEAGKTDEMGTTALMMAAQGGHHRIVRMLLAKEAGIMTLAGKTALMYAAEFGQFECCKLLLGGEGQIHTPTQVTALMHAARNGHVAVVKLLMPMQQGIVGTTGLTAYLCAEEAGHDDCANLLRQAETTANICSLALQSMAGTEGTGTAMLADRSLLLNDLTRTKFRKTGTHRTGIGADLQCELLEKERTINTLKQQVKKQRLKIEQLENAAHLHRDEIASLQKSLQTRKVEIQDLTQQVAVHAQPVSHSLHTSTFADTDAVTVNIPLQGKDINALQMDQLETLDRYLNSSLDTVKTVKATLLASTLSITSAAGAADRQGGNICLVCLENPASIFYLPCQHMVTCRSCEGSLRGDRCPLCRAVIEVSYVAYTN